MNPSQSRFRPFCFPALVLAGGLVCGAGLQLGGLGRSLLRNGLPPAEGAAAQGQSPLADDSTAALSGGAATAAGDGKPAPFSLETFRRTSGLEMHRLLAQVLPGADAALVRTLAEDLAKRDLPGEEERPVWNALFARWAQLNPQEALEWARARDSALLRADPASSATGLSLSTTALLAWGKLDPEAAESSVANEACEENFAFYTAWGEKDPAKAIRHYFAKKGTGAVSILEEDFLNGGGYNPLSRLIHGWASVDPEAAAAFFAAEAPGDTKGISYLAAAWAMKDAGGCAKWMAGLPAAQRAAALQRLAQVAESNPAGVARILNAVPFGKDSLQAGLSLASEWAKKSPGEAQDWVRGWFPEGPQRAHALGKVAESLVAKDFRAAAAVLDEIGWKDWRAQDAKLTKPLKRDSAEFGSKEFSQDAFDPPQDFDGSLASMMGTMDDYAGSFMAMIGVMDRCGSEDPALGRRYWEKADPGIQGALLESFASSWLDQEPAAALEWLAALPASRVNPETMRNVLDQCEDFSPRNMRDWEGRLPAGLLREALVRKTVSAEAPKDPEAAFAALSFPDAASQAVAREEILKQWAERDPRQALDHWLGLAPGDAAGADSPGSGPAVRRETLSSLVKEWTLHDPESASAWVEALPSGVNRDSAVQGLIDTLGDAGSDGNPDLSAALVWSMELSDPAARLKSARKLLPEIARHASTPQALDEAREALERPGLFSEEERLSLETLLEP